MSSSGFLAQARQHLAVAASVFAIIANLGTPIPAAAQDAAAILTTATPIKHVIVIIGENRTFDHVFATYQPKSGETVSNLLSKGIVNADGTPGPSFAQSAPPAADTFTDLIAPNKSFGAQPLLAAFRKLGMPQVLLVAAQKLLMGEPP